MTSKTETATGQVTSFTYDYRNRLTQVTRRGSGGTVLAESSYTYDALDRRIRVTSDADGVGSNPAVTTWTVYDGVNPYADFNGSGQLSERYLYALAVDALLARTDASNDTDWYLTDRLGSVREVADASTGSVEYSAQYDSYGNVIAASGTADRFGYTAREWDGVARLQYNRARYYDPAVGRWVNEDPIQFYSGDANLYRYSNNNSINYVDSLGLKLAPPATIKIPERTSNGNTIFKTYNLHGWPVSQKPKNTIVFIGPPHAVSQNNKIDSHDFKIEYCKKIGIPSKNVFVYNGTNQFIDALIKADKLGLSNPAVVTWGHAGPATILAGSWVKPPKGPNGKPTEEKEKMPVGVLIHALKTLNASAYYNLGCNSFAVIGAGTTQKSWDFHVKIKNSINGIQVFGVVGFDMPYRDILDDEMENTGWYVENGGHIVEILPSK